MGRMDVNMMRYLEHEHFRVLLAVEMGMKNHEIVPLPLIAAIAGIHRGAVARTLSDLCKHSLVAFERSKKFDGYRLTILGYDYLALKALCTRGVVGSVGNKIGVGKESDVYVGGDPELNDLCLKFHRLGRTSFRKVKEKRDYHKNRRSASWLYLSRLAAVKEFAFLKALASRNFPVPRPVDVCRHLVVMGLIEGTTLCHVQHLDDPGALYDRLMSLIVKMGRHGLIHGDFNEFNIMLMPDEKVIMIDFPQMVSMDHPNAEYYFNRDVECIRTLFKRKFDYDSDDFPKFSEVERKHSLDVELEASGFTKQMALDLNKAYDEGNHLAHTQADAVYLNDCDSEEKDEAEDEDTEESDDSDDSDVEDDAIKEEGEDLDEEELREEEADRKRKAQLLKKSDRFTTWLDTATSQLDELALEVDSECPLLVHPQEVDRLEELRKDREAYIKSRELVDKEDEEQAVPVDEVSTTADREMKPRKKVTKSGTRSVATSVTSCPPEEIKRRVALQAFRTKEKVKLRVKGKQSAVRRGRKENYNIVKEYDGWL